MRVRRLALGILVPAVLACSFGQTIPEKRRFVLTASRSGEPGPTCGGTLLVNRFRTSPLFERKGLTYRTGDDTYASRFYDEFYAPPGILLRQASFDWLRDADLFSDVLEPGDPALPAWVLEARIEHLYADVRNGPSVVLDIDFSLLEGVDLAVVWSKRFGARTQAASKASQHLVDAWGRALGELLTLLEQDLRAFVATRERCAIPAGS